MSGFGSMPAGSGPYGLGTPLTGAEAGGVPMTDPNTNNGTGSRLIQNGSYVYDENGRAKGMTNSQQMVLLAVTTAIRSSADQDLGNNLASIDRITDDVSRRIENVVRSALAYAVDTGMIRIDSIATVKLFPSAVAVSVRWFDIASGETQLTEVPVGRR